MRAHEDMGPWIATRPKIALSFVIAVWFEIEHLSEAFGVAPRLRYFNQPETFGDPEWFVWTANLILGAVAVLFAAGLWWVLVNRRGAERVYLAGWALSLLTIPLKDFVPDSRLGLICGLQAVFWLAGLFSSVWMWLEFPHRRHDSHKHS